MKTYKIFFEIQNGKGEKVADGYQCYYDNHDGNDTVVTNLKNDKLVSIDIETKNGLVADEDTFLRLAGEATFKSLNTSLFKDVFEDNFDEKLLDGQTVYTTTKGGII